MITRFTSIKRITVICFIIGIPALVHAQKYTITANITGFPDHTKFYLKDLAAQTDIDSAEIINDKFMLSGKVSGPRTYWLYCHVDKSLYNTTLLMGADKVKITGNARSFRYYLDISGSPSHDVFNIQQKATRALSSERDSLMQLVFTLIYKDDAASQAKSNKMIKRVADIDSTNQAITKQFISTHLNSYAALISLYDFRQTYSHAEMQEFVNRLTPEFKRSIFAQRLISYLKVGDPVKKGDMMADFQAVDQSGKRHSLSSLKGNYILLEFTETYCGACVLSVPGLHTLAEKYPQRLQIVSFYADASKKIWMEGVKRDKPTWLTLWDGEGYYGKTLTKYAINSYPTFIMIDPTGKIVSKWDGYGTTDKGTSTTVATVDKILASRQNQ